MNAILVIIADGRRAIVVIINYFLLYFIDSDKTLRRRPRPTPSEEAPEGGVCSSITSTRASSNPFPVGSQGWGTLFHQNYAAGEENSSIMVGMFLSLCLASKKSSERQFFVTAGTHLGVNSLTTKSVLAGAKNSRPEGFC